MARCLCGWRGMNEERAFRLQASNMRPLFENLYKNIVPNLLAGCPDLEIVVRPYKSKRSNEQNKRLWKIYQTLSEQVWVNGRRFHQDVWHEWCKREFIGCEELPNGEMVGLSTTKLNTAEMVAYQDKIQAWAASEHGIIWAF